jgi:ABC-type branched-subunit amino acid transport system substrate-binding protein
MRHLVVTLAFALTSLGIEGCAVIHDLDAYSIAESKPEVSPSTSSDETTTKIDNQDSRCVRHRDCTQLSTRGGDATSDATTPSVCVRSTGRCAPLVTPECPRIYGDVTNDDAIILGALLGGETALERAAVLAAEEIQSRAGGLPPTQADGAVRPLVLLGCDGGDVLRATRHLVEELHVPAIVGPTTGEAVVDVTQQVSVKGGTLLMTPTAVVSSIANLADEGLTWRAVPSDAQRAKLVIEQMNELETLLRATRSLTTVKLGIVHGTDSLGASARDAISGKLILNGRFINDAANVPNVSVDAHYPGDALALATIATKYATRFKPDIVFITAAEQIPNLLVPLEQALTAGRAEYRPYYVCTEAAKTESLLAAIDSGVLPPDIKRRIRGIGIRPEAGSAPVLAAFTSAFTSRYGAPPPASAMAAAAASYDATYAIAYAIAATPGAPLSGASVAQGLRTFGVGDAEMVGAKAVGEVLRQLSAGRSVALRGTFGPLQWDATGDIAAGNAEVWCVGTSRGAAAFGSSGLTMDVQTQVVGGAFVQCQ